MIVRTLVLCAIGGICLPEIYAHQAAILGFSDSKSALSVHRIVSEARRLHDVDAPVDGSAVTYVAAGANTYAESVFEDVHGVFSVVPGAMYGDTMPVDSVKIVYDPDKITYQHLLNVFWNNIDPTDSEGQFSDRGPQYRTAVFYQDNTQRRIADASLKQVRSVFGPGTATKLLPAGTFKAAKETHQDFFRKHPDRFASYIKHSGRDMFLPVIRSALNERELQEG